MSVLLFRLRNVLDDEADDIRELLNDHHLEFYETSAGNWGISTAAIWLNNTDDLENAKSLIEEYQIKRGISERDKYEQLKISGKNKTLYSAFINKPIRFIVYLIIVGFVIYVSTKPFLMIN